MDKKKADPELAQALEKLEAESSNLRERKEETNKLLAKHLPQKKEPKRDEIMGKRSQTHQKKMIAELSNQIIFYGCLFICAILIVRLLTREQLSTMLEYAVIFICVLGMIAAKKSN